MILRVLLMTAVIGLCHYYLWRRLIRDAAPPRWLYRTGSAGFALLFLAIPVTTMARLSFPMLSRTVGWVAMPWLALVGLATFALLAIDLVRLGGRGATRLGRVARRAARRDEGPGDHGRRLFLSRITGGAVATLAGGATASGMVSARGEHEVNDVELVLPHLPPALDGFTIVQLTDLHVGMTIDRGFVERVVARANALAPDLFVLTGDLVDGRVEDLRDEVAPLGALRARHGVYAVTGNHEYYSGVDPWIAALSALGIRYLRNERVAIGDRAASFDLVGIDDHSAAGYPGHGADLPRALAGRDPARVSILLAHQPRQVEDAAGLVDVQLSGHTHGGQIWPWHYIVRAQQGGWLAGRYQVGATQLHVSRGCGYWGPPVRVGAPLELTRVILRTGPRSANR
jgi:predicted MPP superfamily phosphohydrolase